MIAQCDLSERRACRLVGLSRDTYRHRPMPIAATQALSARLVELAQALHRLGDEAGYLSVIESLLRLPPASAAAYQTRVIDCLIQTHPAKARDQWNKLHAAIASLPDLQPNWMCAHVLQEKRLP